MGGHDAGNLIGAGLERVGHFAGSGGERLRYLFGGLAHRVCHLGGARDQGLGDTRAGRFELLGDVAAAQIEVENDRFARRPERRVCLLGARREGFGKLARGVDDRVREFLRAADHHVDHGERFLREIVGHAVEPRRHHVFQAAGDLGEFLADMVGLEIEAGGKLVTGRRERTRGLFAGAFQAHDQVFAAHAQLLDHIVADLPERHRDVLALLGERVGDAFGRLVDLLADEIADGRQILRQIDVHVVDGGAHLFGLADQRVALVGEILQQAADAHLVVAVGAFERRHFVAHHRFEFARPRQRPLDAVAHGGDFAADRLSDRDDRFTRDAFRLGKTHGDLRHRLRDQPQLL